MMNVESHQLNEKEFEDYGVLSKEACYWAQLYKERGN